MRMHFGMVALLSCGIAWSAQAGWQGRAEADFAVKATMDSFVGKGSSEPITLADNAAELEITFSIVKLETGKKKRDVEMQHMFHAEKHPLIAGRAPRAAVLGLQPAAEAVELPVTLVIAGRTQDVTAQVTQVQRADGQLSFQADFDVSLKAFGLKPPSIMKIINVGDTVKVTTRVSLTADAP